MTFLFMRLHEILDGRVAEWPNASVLKTEVGQPPTVGSNPTSSVLFFVFPKL